MSGSQGVASALGRARVKQYTLTLQQCMSMML